MIHTDRINGYRWSHGNNRGLLLMHCVCTTSASTMILLVTTYFRDQTWLDCWRESGLNLTLDEDCRPDSLVIALVFLVLPGQIVHVIHSFQWSGKNRILWPFAAAIDELTWDIFHNFSDYSEIWVTNTSSPTETTSCVLGCVVSTTICLYKVVINWLLGWFWTRKWMF